jgi:hypothetical protein
MEARDNRERQNPWEPSVHALLRQIFDRGKHTINLQLLISGIQAEMVVILAEN